MRHCKFPEKIHAFTCRRTIYDSLRFASSNKTRSKNYSMTPLIKVEVFQCRMFPNRNSIGAVECNKCAIAAVFVLPEVLIPSALRGAEIIENASELSDA